MKKNENNLLLISEIKKSIDVLKKIELFYRAYSQKKSIKGNDVERAIVLSEMMTSYYTCIETIFFRISQHFENKLIKDKWHQDLLYKMTLNINGVRTNVISEKSYNELLEFLKFRHFKRYYFDFNYDWSKLNFLMKKFSKLFKLVETDLNKFILYLERIGVQ